MKVDLGYGHGPEEVEVVGHGRLGGMTKVRFPSGAELDVATAILGLHRTNDRPTSIAAANAQIDRLTASQIKVLRALVNAGDDGLIDHQHFAINGLGQDSAGKRRGELETKGLVAALDGVTRETPRGPLAIVWVATQAGREWLQTKGAA